MKVRMGGYQGSPISQINYNLNSAEFPDVKTSRYSTLLSPCVLQETIPPDPLDHFARLEL